MEKPSAQLTLLKTQLDSFKNGRFFAKNKKDVLNKAHKLANMTLIAYEEKAIDRLEADNILAAIDEACIQYFNRFNNESLNVEI